MAYLFLVRPRARRQYRLVYSNHRDSLRVLQRSTSHCRCTYIRTRRSISAADIQTAVAAFQASMARGPARYGDIEVISHDEIRIYQDHAPSNYHSMVRVKGKWELGSVVLVHPVY